MLQRAAADRHQMFYTAHQFSSREGFTERLQPTYSKGYSLFLFLSPWDCNKGRGQHCFSSCGVNTQRRTRDEADALNTAVWQITSASAKTRCFQRQTSGVDYTITGDRFTANSWPVSSPKVTVLTEPFTSKVQFTLCLSVNETKGFDKKHWLHIHSAKCQAGEACYYGGWAKWSRLVSWRNALCEHHSTPVEAERATCMQAWLWAHRLKQAVSKPSSTEQGIWPSLESTALELQSRQLLSC